ncbi:hypothetical protein FA13DRAFT_522281 [Coprinellus micaceus]|uniref:Cytochrome P450 n=1 Tax=Coprinellus micaceus TaxID=71717 RepID=A0A4Y7T910_COPMI|nr:hypothetical protein FA13DRAFT_522281 [Coprinellus micaceus]
MLTLDQSIGLCLATWISWQLFKRLLARDLLANIPGPRPDSWLGDTVASAKIPGVYSNMMTFIGGNRACIGVTFAVLEMKVVLSLLLQPFRFSHAPGKKIIWQLNGVIQPTTEDALLTTVGEKKLQLPLKISLIR